MLSYKLIHDYAVKFDNIVKFDGTYLSFLRFYSYVQVANDFYVWNTYILPSVMFSLSRTGVDPFLFTHMQFGYCIS